MNKILTYDRFIECSDIENIKYENYINILENLNENILTDTISKFIKPIKDFIQKISENFKIGMKKVIEAFKKKSVFELLKAIKFNFSLIIKGILELQGLIKNGLFKIFEEISKSKIINKLREGATNIDYLLNKYPIIKKIGGLVIAAILIYMWLNMTFIGDFDTDFNISDITNALIGKFTISDLFLGPSGLMLISLFMTGPYISVAWLGSSTYNLCLAIFYTGYVKLKDSDINIKNKILKLAKG
jgi:hypothetical protein